MKLVRKHPFFLPAVGESTQSEDVINGYYLKSEKFFWTVHFCKLEHYIFIPISHRVLDNYFWWKCIDKTPMVATSMLFSLRVLDNS